MSTSALSLTVSDETIEKFQIIANIAAKYSLLSSVYNKATATHNRQLENSTSNTMEQIEELMDQWDTRELRKLA